MILRRKVLPDELVPALHAFEAVLEEIEPAKAEMTDVVPGTRLPGRPVHDALEGFVARLTRAGASMPAWRRPELESEWTACAHGLATSLGRARELLADAHEASGFEGLLGLVGGLLDPLDPFADAEDRFVSLRRRA